MSRVFLIMSDTTAAAVQAVILARIERLIDTECNNPEVRAEMDAECAVLATVAGQLKEPA